MIRLIDTSDLSLHEFEGRSVPAYAIFSHRWEYGEVTLQEVQGNFALHKPGWLKLRQFCQFAEDRGHRFVWMDTCCIDKSSSAELSESINSMYKWYRRAAICYAYLCDVPTRGSRSVLDWMEVFKGSNWFTRSWTLQELLAPRGLVFVSSDWEQEVGTRESLSGEVREITGVPEKALTKGWSLVDEFGAFEFSAAQIMSWASHRHATRVEDVAYSLIGLFGINMPLLYGEGKNAFVRLQLQIMSKYDDNSIFAWQMPLGSQSFGTTTGLNQSLDLPETFVWGGLLAPSIRCFQGCGGLLVHLRSYEDGHLFSMTNRGIQVEGQLRRYEKSQHGGIHWLLPLNCGLDRIWTHRVGVILAGDGQFGMRVRQGFDSGLVDCEETERSLRAQYEQRRMFIPQSWPEDFD